MVIATNGVPIGAAAERAAPLLCKTAHAVIRAPAEHGRAFARIASSIEAALWVYFQSSRLDGRDSAGGGHVLEISAFSGEGQGGQGEEDGGQGELHGWGDCFESWNGGMYGKWDRTRVWRCECNGLARG